MTQADSLATRRCGDTDLMQVIKLEGGKKRGKSVSTLSFATFLSKDVRVAISHSDSDNRAKTNCKNWNKIYKQYLIIISKLLLQSYSVS